MNERYRYSASGKMVTGWAEETPEAAEFQAWLDSIVPTPERKRPKGPNALPGSRRSRSKARKKALRIQREASFADHCRLSPCFTYISWQVGAAPIGWRPCSHCPNK